MVPIMPHRLCLAPLRGLTDITFRNTFSRFFSGFDLAVAPFIPAVSAARVRPNYLKDVLPEAQEGMPVIPQLLASDPAAFIRTARPLLDMGYDTINWNLGCPWPMVAKKGRGSGMLPFPDRVRAFLDAVVPAMGDGLSIKTRVGRHGPEEIERLIPIFNDYPLRELIIHPRTGVQMYQGRPDLDAFAACLPRCRAPVVYNGDINTVSDFRALSARFSSESADGCGDFAGAEGRLRGWMIGRGALADPFLAGDIKGLASAAGPADRAERFRRFHDALYAAFARLLSGPVHPVERMKGFWYYFSMSFPAGEKSLKGIQKARGPEKYRAAVDAFFAAHSYGGCQEARWVEKMP